MQHKNRYRFITGLGIATIAVILYFKNSLQQWTVQNAILRNPSPPIDLVEEMITTSPDHMKAIVAAWNTGKIPHRLAAVNKIAHDKFAGGALPKELENIVLAGAVDADMDVREVCLGILFKRHHPAFASLVAVQLNDCDPQVRLLGLVYLKKLDGNISVPAAIPLLNDDNPVVVATALKILESASGQKFDVKVGETLPVENKTTGLKEFPEGSREKTKIGAALAMAWWSNHQNEFSSVDLEIPREVITANKLMPAANFSLRSLDGRKINLTDFRGKTVLINFWTTWCTACVGEMPELVALQKEHDLNLVIIGVSLDFVPDEDGDMGGFPAVEEQGQSKSKQPKEEPNQTVQDKIRAKVVRTVNARGINYIVVLDEHNEIGGRFNGGELPTTVIVDPQGNVRRRFIGARSLPVFEAMIAEANALSPVTSVTNISFKFPLLKTVASRGSD